MKKAQNHLYDKIFNSYRLLNKFKCMGRLDGCKIIIGTFRTMWLWTQNSSKNSL